MKVYKVLIVDDEVLVRIGLKSTIDWNSIGFEVIGEAPNGEKAYEMYKLYNPDVIITDIKMPKKDGLWLTKEVRKEDNLTQILVLTCYDDFTNVRQALKYGANNYILKSEVEDEELVNTMLDLKRNLNAMDKVGLGRDKASETLMKTKEQLIEYLIDGSSSFESVDLKDFKQVDFNIDEGKYSILGFFPEAKNMTISTEGKESKNVKNAMLELITWVFSKEKIQCIVKEQGEGFLYLISKEDIKNSQVQEVIKYIKTTVIQYFNIKLDIIYTPIFCDLREFPSRFKEWVDRTKDIFYLPLSSTVETREKRELNDINMLKFEKHSKGVLINFIEECNLEEGKSYVQSIEKEIKNCKISELSCKLMYCNIVASILEKYEEYFEGSDYVTLYQGYYNKIMDSTRIIFISELMCKFIEEISQLVLRIRDQNSKYIINKVVEYIEKNYSNKVTLEDISSHINLSKQYVSFLFKKETGINISSHIIKLRIDKAKEMIIKGEDSMKVIYQRVGFTDQQYFYKTFKKVTGLTVGQYKYSIQQ
ncbi:response regulator [Clostridium sp.]|uniref:response regulator transcription factor n=1 Tax=Clostridium sp. TaxID=1506 RepID=UPI003216C189